jgi:hypothetical protein
MSFYERLPETATILAAGSPPSEGPPKQTGLIISFHSDVLQIHYAAGTGDALLFNRKHLLTERGHDQTTVKRPNFFTPENGEVLGTFPFCFSSS